METNRRIWFPAKTVGWGWGFPVAWQGWAVLAAYVALLFAGGLLLSRPALMPVFLVYVAIVSYALLRIVRATGEPPAAGRRMS